MRITEQYREEHVLPDGLRFVVRPIRPDDRAELARQAAKLSATTRLRRFFTAAPLDDAALDYLTAVDGVDHVALVAVADSLDLKSEVGIGVARFVRLREERHVAEAAAVVLDELQRRGVASALLAALATAARERGVHTFRVVVLESNEPMLALLEKLGAVHRSGEGDGAAEVFDVPLGGATGGAGEDAAGWLRLLRLLAEAIAPFLRRVRRAAGRAEGPAR